jgi:hypothetical protein
VGKNATSSYKSLFCLKIKLLPHLLRILLCLSTYIVNKLEEALLLDVASEEINHIYSSYKDCSYPWV